MHSFMSSLTERDLETVVSKLPDNVKFLLKENDIYLAGGAILSILKDKEVKDYDFFGPDKYYIERVIGDFHAAKESKVISTKNAITLKIKGEPDYQFITRWTFNTSEDVANSFDFAICRVVVYWDKVFQKWASTIDYDFYYDYNMNQISYKRPIRDEDSAGSLLRAFKYAGKGYKVPRNTIADVVARFIKDKKVANQSTLEFDEENLAYHLNGVIDEQYNFRGNY